MRNEVIWNLRDAGKALDIYEWTFLTIVESRGELWSEREKAWNDMRMSRATFYRVRTRLVERGLLYVRERYGTTTIYSVNADAVAALGSAPTETGSAQGEHGGVL